jgi:hypothetical protein
MARKSALPMAALMSGRAPIRQADFTQNFDKVYFSTAGFVPITHYIGLGAMR